MDYLVVPARGKKTSFWARVSGGVTDGAQSAVNRSVVGLWWGREVVNANSSTRENACVSLISFSRVNTMIDEDLARCSLGRRPIRYTGSSREPHVR